MHYFELKKLPEVTESDAGDMLKLWMSLFNAKTEEDLSKIEKIGGELMTQAVQAYRSVVTSDEFLEIERQREKARNDEKAALDYATEKGKAEGIEEVFALLAQGYSVDEAKAILAKKRATERS